MTLEADGRHVRSEDLRKEITVLFDKCCGPQDTESPMQRLKIPGVFETHVADLGTVSHDCRYYMPQTHRHKHRRRQTTPLYITFYMECNRIRHFAPNFDSVSKLDHELQTSKAQRDLDQILEEHVSNSCVVESVIH